MKEKLPTELNSAEEILQIWKTNRKEATDHLTLLNDDELKARPEGKWSISEVGEHLYISQWNVARMIPAVLSSKIGFDVGEQKDLDFRRMRIGLAKPTGFKNPENFSPLNNYSLSELNPLLEKSMKKLEENLIGKTKSELEVRGVEHPAFGPLNLFNFLWVMSLHEGLHSFAIKDRVNKIKGK
jgi:hypothetical protein